MNTKDYVNEADRQLSDTNTYKKQENDLTIKHQEEVNEYLNQMVANGDITESIAKILRTLIPSTPQIYFLPKIHKGTIPPPGRPIVSANGYPTEKISAFVDHFLNPMVEKTKSYVEDTTVFLRKIESLDKLKPNSIIGTMDVSSLYTNIPNIEGINCIKELLNKKRNKFEKAGNESLTDFLEMGLTKNNRENYLQIGGTAMGTKVAPLLSNLFIERLEELMLHTYDKTKNCG